MLCDSYGVVIMVYPNPMTFIWEPCLNADEEELVSDGEVGRGIRREQVYEGTDL